MLESAQNLAAAPRSTGSLLPHTWRLTKWELFLTRRRVMSKVLASILLGGYVIVIGFMLISYSVAASRGATDIELSPLRDLLTFPGVLVVGGIYTAQLGPLMACVLAGALVGSEYGYSTQRLAFSRGAGRGQMLAAQAGALALLALGTVGGMLALSALVGVTFGPAIGGSISAPPPGGWTEIVAYWLVLSLVLFAYASLALFFATLGRSVAAGIGLALGLLFVENIVRFILLGVGTVPGAFFQFVG
ncbi:MAG: hypothetical protein IVW57_15325, partial [Ktedonobacterales bacterium]|nr:hypothetical protein [Ktedonobacterales bacterium]